MKPGSMPEGYWKEGHPRQENRKNKGFWSVSVLGMFAGNSEEARGLELILGRGGCSRELGQRGNQRTLYQKDQRWKLFNYIF